LCLVTLDTHFCWNTDEHK